MRYLALVILLGVTASLFGQNNSIALSQMKYAPAPNYAIITTTSGRQIYIEKDSFDIDTRLVAGWHSNDTLYLQVSRVSGQMPGPIDTIAVYIPAGGGGGGATYINAGSGISVTGAGTLANPFVITNTAPDQIVSITGSTGITVGGSYPNFSLSVADQSATNELQTLSISNDTLSISSGNSVVLPIGDTCTIVAKCQTIVDLYLPDGLDEVYLKTTWVDNGSQGCDIDFMAISRDSVNFSDEIKFDCTDISWPYQSHMIVLMVSDIHGNTSTCDSEIWLYDLGRPQILCKDIYVNNSLGIDSTADDIKFISANNAIIYKNDVLHLDFLADTCGISAYGFVDPLFPSSYINPLDSVIYSLGTTPKLDAVINYTLIAIDNNLNRSFCSAQVIFNDPFRGDNSGGGGGVDTATFLQQDSILIYSVAGVEFGRDTIRTAGGGGDDWGTQVVISDTTLIGNGTSGNPLGVDTAQIATHYYISEGFTTKYIDFDTTFANNYAEGRMKWNVDENSVEIGLSANLSGTVLMDDYWYVKNQTGSAINAGQLVYASGTLGTSGRILVSPYIANGTIDAKYVLGVVAETIPDGGDGYVITKGKLRGINTSAYADGTVLWASTANAGNLTDTVPQAPNFRLPVAFVVKSDANGIMAVRVTTGSDLYEDHRVQVTTPLGDQLLRYNSTSQRWENWSPNFALTDTSGYNNYLSISNDTLYVGDNNDTLSVVIPPQVLKIRDVTVTEDTIVTADLGKLIRCNNAGAITLRIHTNFTQPLPIGAVITVEQAGAGVVTITPISGVTINPTARKTWGQYSVIQLIKVGTNTWNVVGGID